MQQEPRGQGEAGKSMNTAHGTGAMPQMKASDADRDAVLADLSRHFEAGRLTSQELDERTGRALTARTLHELQDLMNDLPDAQPAVPAAATLSPRHGYPALAPVIVALAVVAIVSIVAGAVHGSPAWSAWWIIPAALIARRLTCRRAARGSGS
jgi:hypothetical protein